MTADTDLSTLTQVGYRCEAGHVTEQLGWAVIDLVHRPDLVAMVTDATWTEKPCGTCARPADRLHPLGVVFQIPGAPTVLFAGPGLEGGFPDLSELIALLGGPPRSWAVSIEVLALAVQRDLVKEAQADEPPFDAALKTAGDAGEQYVQVLVAIRTDVRAEAVLYASAHLVAADSQEGFRQILDQHPELFGVEAGLVLDQLADLGHAVYARARAVINSAREDRGAAWHELEREQVATEQELARGAEERRERLQAAEALADVVQLTEEALHWALMNGVDSRFSVWVLRSRASRYVAARDGDWNDQLHAAARDFEAALELTQDARERAEILHDSGLLQARLPDDRIPGRRVREALAMLNEGLELLNEDKDEDLVHLFESNTLYVTSLLGAQASEGELWRAHELGVQALEYRSFERGPEDWAYTLLNLAAIRSWLGVGEGRGVADHLQSADQLEQAVIDRADALPDVLVAHARSRSFERRFDRHERRLANEEAADPDEVRELLALGRLVVDSEQAEPVTWGRAYRRLAELLLALDAQTDVRDVLRAAVQGVEGIDLDEQLLAASALGYQRSLREEWPEAAEAYRLALAALDLLVAAAAQAGTEAEAQKRSVRLPRWAAHAFLEAGDAAAAVVALENGRTRELRRLLLLENPDLDALQELRGELVDEWRRSGLSLAASSRANFQRAAERHERAVQAIRAVPGYSDFARATTLEQIAEAADADMPVVYLNTVPQRSSLLRVDPDGTVTTRWVQATSRDVIHRLLFGVSYEWLMAHDVEDFDPATQASYTLAVAGGAAEGVSPRRALRVALDNLLPWVGDEFAQPLQELLSGCRGCLLIVCGPLSAVPLAAAPFGPDGRCLLDCMAVATTPSAAAHRTARRRSSSPEVQLGRLVAVADCNADAPLPSARNEVAEVATRFDSANVAVGEDATLQWLGAVAPGADVIHLACHAHGGLFDASDAGFDLADGELTGQDVTALPLEGVRLAVASACQSAVTEMGDGGDEAFSLGLALLSAGSAASIATLWPVNDQATALLACRLYDNLAAGSAPVEALRAAQLWLRDLDDPDLAAYHEEHPALKALSGTTADPRRGDGAPAPAADHHQRRFRHPEYWAAFVTLGA